MKIDKLTTFNLDQQQHFKKIILAIDFIREETQPYFFIQSPAETKNIFLYSILYYHYYIYVFYIAFLVLFYYYYQKNAHFIFAFRFFLIFMRVYNAILVKI